MSFLFIFQHITLCKSVTEIKAKYGKTQSDTKSKCNNRKCLIEGRIEREREGEREKRRNSLYSFLDQIEILYKWILNFVADTDG